MSSEPSPHARAVAQSTADLYPRKVLFVVGAGRSGTSTIAGITKLLGLHVPQPEVTADETNPKGFGEPAWCVEFHDRLLKAANVQVSDSRPDAWFETGRIAAHEEERARAADWLAPHFAEASELVVKDPRLSWFLTLWQAAALRVDASAVTATMLRPPAEVVGSKQKYYANRLGSAHLAASWVNMLLHTERATRDGGARGFVRYADLLDDWVRTTQQLAETLELQSILHAKSEQIRDVHRFVDPGLRRVTTDLADLGLPGRLHDLVAGTWEELNKLAEPGGDTAQVRETLDQLREEYAELYSEAEAISRSSVVAAEHRLKRRGPAAPAAPAPASASVADRIPHGVRAAIPPSVRRGVRKALRRER